MSLFSPSRRSLASFVGCVALVGLPSVARAEDPSKADCASAYESSQELRSSGKLRKAHRALSICAQDACPSFVRTDCVQWLEEVGKELASIVISAKDQHGEAMTAVRVLVDGELVTDEIEPKALPIEPGHHKLRFEIEGAPAVEQQLDLEKGEKEHEVQVTFESKHAGAPAADAPEGDESAKEPPKAEAPVDDGGKAGPLRPYAYVAGGVGAAGVIGFIAFGAMGSSAQSDLEASNCKPNCAQSEVDSIKTKYLLADVSLGVGIAGLGAGVALFLLSQPKGDAPNAADTGALHFDVRATPSLAYATVSSRF